MVSFATRDGVSVSFNSTGTHRQTPAEPSRMLVCSGETPLPEDQRTTRQPDSTRRSRLCPGTHQESAVLKSRGVFFDIEVGVFVLPPTDLSAHHMSCVTTDTDATNPSLSTGLPTRTARSRHDSFV